MATNPVFAATPKWASLVLNNANGGDTAYINPTTVATVLTVGASGALINTVYIRPAGTNASTTVRFWVDTVGSGGAENRLIDEELVPASTSSGVATLTPAIWRPAIALPANAVIRATISNTAVTNGVIVSVEYSEF